MKFFFSCLFGFVLLFGGGNAAFAETPSNARGLTQLQARIERIETEQALEHERWSYVFWAKTAQGESVRVQTSDSSETGIAIKLSAGDRVYLEKLGGEPPMYFFEDVDRTAPLLWIVGLFFAISIMVGGKRGVASMFGLLVTILVLFGFLFPALLNGAPVLPMTILGSVIILAVNMHISHGFRRESFLAFLSTVIGLFLIVGLSFVFTQWTRISGTGAEEATFLASLFPAHLTTIRIFLAAVILGAVGVLDDVAIAQTEMVFELAATDPSLSRRQLFLKAMRIGKHHIASTVHTLILVYAGAAFPVLLLFLYHAGNVRSFVNSGVVTEELVRTIAGTIGLICTVPIATGLAVLGYKKSALTHPTPSSNVHV